MEKLNITIDFLLNYVNSLSIFRRVSVIFNFDFSHLSLNLERKRKNMQMKTFFKKKFCHLKKISVTLATPVLAKPSAESSKTKGGGGEP